MNTFSIIMILTGVLFNAFAQLALKSGANRIVSFDNKLGLIESIQSAINFPILLGLSFYVISVILWIVALTKVPVSIAYPMLSIGYVVVTVLGYFLYNEPITPYKLFALAVIIFGVILISRAS